MSRKKSAAAAAAPVRSGGAIPGAETDAPAILELVLKCDSAGAVEAVRSAISAIRVPGVGIQVIQAGVGTISKRDVLMAQTGSRLILGFNVAVAPRLDMELAARCVEIRCYSVIYTLTGDLEKIAQRLRPREARETVLGRGKVIAVFPAGARGVIVGCEVLDGTFVAGKPFRLISAMGPVFSGRIESMQIDRQPVKQAPVGRNVGILVPGRKKAQLGDQVECFEPSDVRETSPWQPTCGVFQIGG